MQQILARMVDIVVSLFETFGGVSGNLAKVGLGVGGLGLTNEIMQRMLISPETERAMRDIFPEGRDREIGGLRHNGSVTYHPTDSDFQTWRHEISVKMDKEMEKMGLSKDAATLFKKRTGNLAYKIDRLCRRYTDPIIRNQKVSELIDKEIVKSVELAKQERERGMTNAHLGKREENTGLGNITGGMKEQPAFFNGLSSSTGVPIWVPHEAKERLGRSSEQMEKLHAQHLETLEKAARQANEKLSLQSVEEGLKKGVLTPDDVLSCGIKMYDTGDNLLLNKIGVVTRYEEYKASLLLNNGPRADRLWNEMRGMASDYTREMRGEMSHAFGHELGIGEQQGQMAGMGFGLKL